jgi:hypothetical protein
MYGNYQSPDLQINHSLFFVLQAEYHSDQEIPADWKK